MKRDKKQPIRLMASLLCAGMMGGCSHLGVKRENSEKKLNVTLAALEEESRALTTAVVDVLSVAPSNAPTALALELAKHDQQIEGVSAARINVGALMGADPAAVESLTERYRRQEELLRQKKGEESELHEAERELAAMGKLYESEHNRSLVRRIWSWALGTLGVGGVIAACILFPALIPLAGSLVGWLVGRAPGLAGWFGVVGKKAFDSVVTGVGKARSEFKKSEKPESLELLNTELAKATDRADRKIIDARREALNV